MPPLPADPERRRCDAGKIPARLTVVAAELLDVDSSRARHPTRASTILHGVEFGRLGRQEFQLHVAALCVDVMAHQPAAMSAQPIPDDEQLALGEMALEALE